MQLLTPPKRDLAEGYCFVYLEKRVYLCVFFNTFYSLFFVVS